MKWEDEILKGGQGHTSTDVFNTAVGCAMVIIVLGLIVSIWKWLV